MKDIYNEWRPVPEIKNEMWVKSLHSQNEELEVLLQANGPNSPILSIKFEHYYLYRNTNESYRIRLWEQGRFNLTKSNWQFCITTSSELIDWLSEEEGPVFLDKKEMTHYLIKTYTDVIDVVTPSKFPPEVKWLSK